MLRKWVIDAQRAEPRVPRTPLPEAERPLPGPTFIPLALTAPVVDGEIRIELQRSGATINIVWPASASRDCAAWLRDWLR